MQNPEYIVTIAEERSLLRAAEKLFVSQSALSQYVSKLEAELNTPLFVRSRSGWTPTAAGEIYIDLARNVLHLQQHAYTQISLVAGSLTHTLCVGINPGRMTDMIAACIPKFTSRFPNARVVLKEDSVGELLRMLRSQKIDVGFLSYSSGFSGMGEIASEPLLTERFVLALPAAHPFTPTVDGEPAPGVPPTIRLAECDRLDFMLMQRDTTLRQAQDTLFRNAGFEPRVIFESGSSQTTRTLMKIGYAAALIPEGYMTSSDLMRYYYVDDPLRWNMYAAYPCGHELTAPEEYMVALAKAYCQELSARRAP